MNVPMNDSQCGTDFQISDLIEEPIVFEFPLDWKAKGHVMNRKLFKSFMLNQNGQFVEVGGFKLMNYQELLGLHFKQ